MLVRQLSPESLNPQSDVGEPRPRRRASRPGAGRPQTGPRAVGRRLGTTSWWLYAGHLISLWALALSNLVHGLALIAAGVKWRARALPRWQWSRWSAVLGPLAAYVVFLIVSVGFSYDPRMSLEELNDVFVLSTLPLGALLVRGPRATRRLIDALLVVITLLALFGIGQYYLTDFGSLDNRIPGPFSHYQTFAGVLLIGDLLLIARLVSPTTGPRWPQWLAFSIVSWTLFLTLTRGSWVALVAAFAVIVVLRGRRRALALGLLALVVAMALAPASWRTRVQTIWDLRDASNYDRLCMLEAGAYMVRERPLFGLGPEMVRERYPIYRHPTAPRYEVTHLHNSFVQLAAERGLLSLGAYLWMMAAVFVLAYRGYRRTLRRGGGRADLYLGVLLVLVGFNVAGLFEANWRDTEVQRLVLFVLAVPLCLRAARASRPSGSSLSQAPGSVVTLGDR